LKRQVWNIYAKYRRIPTNCPVCSESMTLFTLKRHLREAHAIDEGDEGWKCPICRRAFAVRETWLGHVEVKHKQLATPTHMEQLVEAAGLEHSKVDWEDLEVKFEDARRKLLVKDQPKPTRDRRRRPASVAPKKGHLAPPPSKKVKKPPSRKKEDRKLRCDECGKSFPPHYLPTHKEAMHTAYPQLKKCPSCDKEFNESNIWYHYCQFHLQGSGLEALDPVTSNPIVVDTTPIIPPVNHSHQTGNRRQTQAPPTTVFPSPLLLVTNAEKLFPLRTLLNATSKIRMREGRAPNLFALIAPNSSKSRTRWSLISKGFTKAKSKASAITAERISSQVASYGDI